MARNKFQLTFMGGDDVSEDDRTNFVRLVLATWPTLRIEVLTTLFALLDDYPAEIIEVIARKDGTQLVVHVYDVAEWVQTPGTPALFHTKIDPSGTYA